MPKTRNKFEADVASQLDKAGVRYKYENRKVPYVLAKHYINDFDLLDHNFLIETKGYLRNEDRAKLVALKRQHPNLDIRIVFQVYRESYVKWAKKHGFKYAIKFVPKEWLQQ